MSIDVMSKILRTSKLIGMERFTLVVLADVGNADGTSIYISRLTIAKRSGQSVASVRQRLEYLKGAGVLSWASCGHKNKNGQDTNEYQINVHCIGNEDVINAKQIDRETRFNVEPSSTLNLPLGSTLNLPLGSTLNHNPSSDSSINQEGAAAPVPMKSPTTDRGIQSFTGTSKPQTTTPPPATPRDPLGDAFTRATRPATAATVIRAWNASPDLNDLCIAFADIFKLQVTKADQGKWLGGAARLNELHPTRDELRRVHAEAKGITVTHPGACYEMVKAIRAHAEVAKQDAPTHPAILPGKKIARWIETSGGMQPVYEAVQP